MEIPSEIIYTVVGTGAAAIVALWRRQVASEKRCQTENADLVQRLREVENYQRDQLYGMLTKAVHVLKENGAKMDDETPPVPSLTQPRRSGSGIITLSCLCLFVLPGCGIFRRDEQAQTSERTVETPLANGGKITVREMRTDTTTHSGLDDALVANMAKLGVSAATGDWGTIIGVGGTALAAAAAGFAKSKHTEAERQRADADQAWDKYMAEKDAKAQ